MNMHATALLLYDTPLSDQQMSEYDLKLLPREDSFDFGEDTY